MAVRTNRAVAAPGACPLCGGTGRVKVRVRGGEVEAACPECLEEEEGLWCFLCGAPITEEGHALYVEPGVVEPVCGECRGWDG
jgi:ribosome-binding protein aMBF1 (putative translation factor)